MGISIPFPFTNGLTIVCVCVCVFVDECMKGATSNCTKVHIEGIPRSKLSKKLLKHMKELVFKEYKPKRLRIERDKVLIVFERSVTEQQITNMTMELRDVLEETSYGAKVWVQPIQNVRSSQSLMLSI